MFTLPLGCNAESGTCDCCPSGKACEPGTCNDPLGPDEGFHLRLAEMPKNGEADLVTSHPSAEVCIKLSDVEQYTCTPIRELADGGSASPHLFASTLDLTTKGVDVLVHFPLPGNVKSPLASAQKVVVANAPRAILCKGVEVKLEGHVPVDSVRFYVDDDVQPAPQRRECP
jgi:hypothetical protein